MSHYTADDHLDPNDSKPRRRSTGRLYGARNYSKQMVTLLLDSVENVLPIEQDEWQAVADQFNYHFSDNRQVKSIRRKFMDMVNDRKTTAANAPEEVRRAKALHVKIMNKRRQNPHLGKEPNDDLDDDSSVSSHEEEYGHELQQRVSEYAAAPSIPVSSVDVNVNRDRNRVSVKFPQASTPTIYREAETIPAPLEPTNPLIIQVVKVLQQHHQQYDLPFQQQLLDQLQIIQRQNQDILEALNHQHKAGGSKKRAREGEDSEGL